MNLFLIVILDALIWALWSFIVGYTFNKLNPRVFCKEKFFVTKSTSNFYRVIKINRWKDVVPEAGAMFKGGTSKKHIGGTSPQHLKTYIVETRRAEAVHYALIAITPVFLLFNPWYLSLAMIAYAAIANIPCILIQRYNRSRCIRLLHSLNIDDQ